MTDNTDPDQTAPFGAVIWVQTVQLQKEEQFDLGTHCLQLYLSEY